MMNPSKRMTKDLVKIAAYVDDKPEHYFMYVFYRLLIQVQEILIPQTLHDS